ncbi:expressed unknown protein [Seminavis robusta]|uniref:PUB domain-containing protein n=1 Tax=Seminavis robusta TaxID=568900 RepID=A0A9N8EB18_9STRA|nr:expressed unknown protein [Seminavis robusta]|eukprot:Sro705_g190300.1 n/a (195) ;mRNA; r:16630-17214
MASPPTSEQRSYKQATGRFKLLCAFDAAFPSIHTGSSKASNSEKEEQLARAKILKTLVSNARAKRDPKYQTIHLENPKIQVYVATNEAAMTLLETVGFTKSNDNGNSLIYKPTETSHFQFASRLQSMLDGKIDQLRKASLDTATKEQKKHKSAAKASKKDAKIVRKTQVRLYHEDRERQRMYGPNGGRKLGSSS